MNTDLDAGFQDYNDEEHNAASYKSIMPHCGDDDESLGFNKSKSILDREDPYKRRRLNLVTSPERQDAFATMPKPETRGYAESMRKAALKREEQMTFKVIARKKKQEEEIKAAGNKWNRSWDDAKSSSDWDMPNLTHGIGRWDATPTPGRMDGYTGRKTSEVKVKNGTPQQRKTALRQLTDKDRAFGAGPLFNSILPLLMQPTLEDQERHLLVKVIDRVIYKLDDLVRPYVHKILVVIEPLLIDEDYYSRVEGTEIISNLSKAAGLATMIATMRPDIDNIDEYVRNTTARAFSFVTSALGIVIIEHGLNDENQKVRTITALSLVALAEAAAPYGIESFDSVLKPLWKGIRSHRGKVLAAFLKAIGFIIPLMDANYASYYTKEVMKFVLKVVKQCVSTQGVEADYIRTNILSEYFKNFWVRQMALDSRSSSRGRVPEVLGSILGALKAIVNVIGMTKMTPPIKDLLPHLTSILKNRHEKVQENYVDLVGRISDRGAEYVPAREWMRICFELLEMLKAHKKGIRRAAVNTFGYIAKAIGPQDVLATLLNNLKVQERQSRVCTTVAIAITAETCSPFTIYKW
ncbi:hypothetical protein CTI12_AA554570 [Artemisia annua]|uniref:Phosphatase PP2A regulatory subunit A/Splicing factor 3B subunit 1-like HEAT repeat domain-containing protein n=1 Tax=Artemisia annua TaxID=35608 RepID=A0A2U1KX46_ARTAN|nr:hypothetical protein CTI12_AA554570 [Artemisia annua]